MTPKQLMLGELIERLKTEDPDMVLPLGFHEPHSYRGYYWDVAFAVAHDVKVGDMLACAQSALGATYQGWKGGDFVMGEYTDCWLVTQEGDTGESIGSVLLHFMLEAGHS
jgi:hypothetical protein